MKTLKDDKVIIISLEFFLCVLPAAAAVVAVLNVP
jgi:hypothetical protein